MFTNKLSNVLCRFLQLSIFSILPNLVHFQYPAKFNHTFDLIIHLILEDTLPPTNNVWLYPHSPPPPPPPE